MKISSSTIKKDRIKSEENNKIMYIFAAQKSKDDFYRSNDTKTSEILRKQHKINGYGEECTILLQQERIRRSKE